MDAPVPVNREENAPPPCFNWKSCAQRAAVEKGGRSVCQGCSNHMRGVEYPLRAPSLQPLYLTGRAVAEAMGISDE